MPTRTHDEQPQVEPPPALVLDELQGQHFTAELRLLNALRKCTERHDADDSGDRCSTNLSTLSEAELLGVMSMQRVSPDLARHAWAEMYNRHSRYVFAVVSNCAPRWSDGVHEVSDVVVDTFHAAFEWAGRQTHTEDVIRNFNGPDRDATRRNTLGWLATIARRAAVESFANNNRAPVSRFDGDLDSASFGTAEDAEPPSAYLKDLLSQALAKLSTEERDAIYVSLPWYEPETGEFAFPRGEAALTAVSLGITTAALRQRRHRALHRLESLLIARTTA